MNINITYWDFGDVNTNITYWDIRSFQKKHSLVGMMHTPRQKNTFSKSRVCKRQKISSTSTKVGLFQEGYQNDRHITRNIFHPTFKKVPSRNPTKDLCSYTVLLVGPEVPLRRCKTTYYNSNTLSH